MAGFLGANRIPEKMLRPSANSSVPSTAPMILLSSNESMRKLRQAAGGFIGRSRRARADGRSARSPAGPDNGERAGSRSRGGGGQGQPRAAKRVRDGIRHDNGARPVLSRATHRRVRAPSTGERGMTVPNRIAFQ